MKRVSSVVAAVCAAFVLAGCGGGSDGGTPVASANTSATINASTGAALVQGISAQTLSFASGVPAFGTSADTSVTLNAGASGAGNSFSIASGGNSASGDLGFGSCIFKITTSTFPAGHPLSVGKSIEVDPCTISIATANQEATGSPVSTPVSLVLGAATSAPKALPITITSGGTVQIVNPANGKTVPLGTVSVTVVTGAG